MTNSAFVLRLLACSLLSFAVSCGSPKVEEGKEVRDTGRVHRKKETPLKAGIDYPKELIKGSRTPYEDAIGRKGDTIYYSSYKGRVEYSDTLRHERHLLFNIKAEFMVDRIYVSRTGDDAYFAAWQETDHNGIRTYFAVFKVGQEKPEWKKMFPVPNPGQPVIDGNYAYVTTLGMAGKISLADGSFAWQYDSLYNTASQTYQKFEPPLVFDDKIYFVDYPIPGRRNNRDTLKVAPDGKRLR